MAAVMAFLQAHGVVILTILLGISELLALAFPGAGGFFAGAIALLKQLGAKDPKDQQ